VLDVLLGDTPLPTFLASSFRKAPLARPDLAAPAKPLFDWKSFDRILRADRPDVLVVRRGRLLDRPAPRSLDEARALLDEGLSFVVRRAQELDASLFALARSFAECIPGEVQIQLFITPKGERGFGWHYDVEDVFILQTVGAKKYFFRQNTIDPTPQPRPDLDFTAIARETSPTMTCTLVAGDWLYLPRAWWHVATAVEDSLAISVGVAEEGPPPSSSPPDTSTPKPCARPVAGGMLGR